MRPRPSSVQDMLQKHGIKPSFQRIQVLGKILEHGGHPTADEVYGWLSEIRPPIARATVYNTLNHLVDHGLLERFTVNRLETRYDLRLEHHGHFVCTRCGQVEDIPFPGEPDSPGLEGYQIERADWLLRGSCPGCLEQIEKPPTSDQMPDSDARRAADVNLTKRSTT
ncbi:MAG: Fur family transcriptional regulator [Bacillota bacterium]|nr:Fur family transcriptional regulator [Bacillota bacterium]